MKNIIATAVVTTACLAGPASAETGWAPTRPIEFIVTGGPGGGTDQFARTVQSIITKHNLVDQSIVVLNKGGGSGAEGFVYGKLAAGEPHKLVFATSNEWMLPLVAKLAYKYDELKPVSVMAFDEFVLWTRPDAPYKDAKGMLAAAAAAPGELKFGGSQSKDVDQLLVRQIEKAASVKFTYIPFKSGSEAAVQLAGSHIDGNTNNPSESLGQWKAGSNLPLCVFSPQPMAAGPKVTETQAWSDIPTCKSAGVPIDEYRLPRTVFTPAGVADDVTAYYVGLMEKVRATPEWQGYIERTAQTDRFMNAADLTAYIAKDEPKAQDIFKGEGWLVN